MSHNCSTLVLHCIDFRLQPEIKSWLERENLLGDCDIVSVAGAAKDIDEGSDFVMNQIDISYRLHNMRRVILLNHTDCGAYGGRMEDDEVKHTEIMTRAAKVLQDKYSDLEVQKMLAKIDEDGGVEIVEA